jgi:hypothetical protein
MRTLAVASAAPDLAARLADLDAGRACVRETLRLWPTTLVILRDTTRGWRWREVDLPAGTTIVVPTAYVHRRHHRSTRKMLMIAIRARRRDLGQEHEGMTETACELSTRARTASLTRWAHEADRAAALRPGSRWFPCAVRAGARRDGRLPTLPSVRCEARSRRRRT